ncbi:MAG: cupin domain-containing protein [Oceanicaulis sp.]|nr:cupin domain-containing protein [Oceanicaulis sp.]
MGVNEIVRMLNLTAHPEGGWYGETFRSAPPAPGEREALSLIWFLLGADQVSAWHRVDADEAWFWHAGAPLVLTVSEDGMRARTARLGPDLRTGDRPQALVPAQAWQTAESLGAWTLVSCAVAPAFRFEGFRLAPPHWRPGPEGPPRG